MDEAPTTPLIETIVILFIKIMMVVAYLTMMKTGMEGEKVMVIPESRRRKEATSREIFRPNLNLAKVRRRNGQ